MKHIMRNSLGLLLGSLLLCAFVSCTQKKDRLTADTLTITVDPSAAQTLSAGSTLSLKAVCRSAKSDNVDVSPTWSVESNLGTFSSSTGKTTVFTAGSTAGSGKIYATYGSVRGSVDITVTAGGGGGDDGGGGGGSSTTIYGIYSETYITPIYSMLKYDTANPSDADGGCMGQYADAVISASMVEKMEGTESIRCVLTAGVGWGGWWIQFGSDSTPGFNSDARALKDMSNFSGGSLKFDVKTPQNLKITIESGNLGSPGTAFIWLGDISASLLDNGWHSVSIPLSNFTGAIDLTKIQIPAGFNSGTSNFTFYIDNVRWEK